MNRFLASLAVAVAVSTASAQAQPIGVAPSDRTGGDRADANPMWSTPDPVSLKGEQAAGPRTLYVDDDGSQDPWLGDPTLSDPMEDGSVLHPFDAIQEAVDAAGDGDTVVIEDGTYAGAGNRDIDFHGKAITVRSRNGPATCIIDCGGSEEDPHRGFYFHSRETPNAVLKGLTIKHGFVSGNGNWETRQGGGILALYSSPVIQLCILTENTASWCGGGVYCSEQTVVQDCTVTHNRAGAGGGLYCGMGSPLIRGNVISENVAEQDGGGVGCFERARVIGNTIIANRASLGGGISSCEDYPASIIGNVIRNNWAEQGGGGISLSWDYNTLVFGNLIAENSTNGLGGGILLSTDPADIVNNTIVNNWATRGGGIYGGWGNVVNCIIWGNSDGIAWYGTEGYPFCTVTWSCTQNEMPGEGNIRIDPSFVEGEGDYRLRSHSPCIDAGRTSSVPADTFDLDGDGNTAEPVPFDLMGDTRVVGAAVDMGAYEFPADCNGNGVPDNRDIGGGGSNDCNANGVPDECEPDRDKDGLPDTCDPLTLLYVDADATGANDGSSWANAFTDLQSALAVAYNPGGGTVTHIWIAEGLYRPTWLADWADPPDPRSATFEIPNNAALYGGFAGSETSLGQRNPVLHETILSGDLNANDVTPADPSRLWWDNSRDDNCYHVVTFSGVDPTTVLDGVTITGGKANIIAGGKWMGGGVFNVEGSPTIARCLFLWNMAEQGGGLFSTHTSHPKLTNCSFRGNWGNDCGGGMYNREAESELVNCEFTGNYVEDWGGGAIFNSRGTLVLANCTITGNRASDGGSGIYNSEAGATITNSIIWGDYRDEIAFAQSTIITYCLLPGGWDDSGDIDADPLFVDADGPDNVFGTRDDNVSLRPESPCLNAGSNAAVPSDAADLDQDSDHAEITPYDLAGRRRIAAAIVDMGSYEYQPDCNGNGTPDDRDIQEGTSRDCNSNGIPDECDISSATTAWSKPFPFATGPEPFCMTTGDVNQDGRVDLAMAYWGTWNGSHYVGSGVSALINHGNGAFVAEHGATGGRPAALAIADFNDDGRPDLATVGEDACTLSLLAQEESGAFSQETTIFISGALGSSLAAGDLDGTGRPEFVVGHGNGLTVVAYEDGEGYRPVGHYLEGVWISSVALADLDGNGHLDIVTTSQSATAVHVLLNRGNGLFDEPVAYTQGVDEAQHVTAADLDGDGDLDLAVADQGLDAVLIMLNQGGGIFTPARAYDLGDSASPRATAAADFDGDGDIDLAVSNIAGPNLFLLWNEGHGRFGAPVPIDAGFAQWFVTTGDLNGDGRSDLAVVGSPDEGAILWNESMMASRDCNSNGVPDECDIRTGHSPDADGNGVPDECELQPCRATRTLPRAYAPGLAASVTIQVQPPSGAAAYALEDVPPAGWAVGVISDGGVFDAANGKVKWGPYLDNSARTLRYDVTPPLGTDGQTCFGPGMMSTDGTAEPICGSSCIETCPTHPADGNKDRRLAIDEVTAYAACWKQGCVWPVPPSPIPIGLMTRAGYLWKNGESYCCDARLPVLWVNCAREDGVVAAAQPDTASAATRALRIGDGNSLLVSIAVTHADAAAYAIEEKSPAGWSVSAMSHDGHLDEAAGVIRWGPFFDGQDRTLSYRLTPSMVERAAQLAGTHSADGYDSGIAGAQAIPPGFAPADFDRDYDVDQKDLEHLGSCSTGASVPQSDPACGDADLDGDGDVDQCDFGLFQRCLTGEQMPADPNCAR